MDLYKFIDKDITKSEALELTKLKGTKLQELCLIANKIRDKYCGDEISLCTISNAKSGKCEEDCRFCAQSSHYDVKIDTYNLKNNDILQQEAERAKKLGSSKFGIVTSGRSIKHGTADYKNIKTFITDFYNSNETQPCENNIQNLDICCSIGLLNENELLELKKAGMTRIHSNLQTSISSYNKIVSTTHNIQDRINTIKSAKKLGLEVCSGGIIGMGETWEDRIDMAFTLKSLDVDGIPINILNPIKGTPMQNNEYLRMDDIIKTIAIFRIIFKNKIIKLGAGRENIIKDFIGTAFMSGANGMLIGGYLTTKGREEIEDKILIENIKKMWANK